MKDLSIVNLKNKNKFILLLISLSFLTNISFGASIPNEDALMDDLHKKDLLLELEELREIVVEKKEEKEDVVIEKKEDKKDVVVDKNVQSDNFQYWMLSYANLSLFYINPAV